MAPVTVMEAELEDRQTVSQRHRVLIAAAVAAVVDGRFRIVAIDPVRQPAPWGWKHCGRMAPSAARAAPRRHLEIRTDTASEEETYATSNHA